jgi:RNA polymerase sigma factor (sigma-70 family)
LISKQQETYLLSGCKAGSRKAQEQLYRSFYGAMMNLCLRYTKNDMDAMEALNTGFYKVFKNIEKYNPAQSSLYTWIRIIIINSCLDIIGINKKTIMKASLDEASEVSNEAGIFSKINSEHLLQMVRQLPLATQTVFNLFTIEGYSHKEIASLMNISEGTSKWHVSDARKKLQTIIIDGNKR